MVYLEVRAANFRPMYGKVAMAEKCGACKNGIQKPMAFSMAFQPIVDIVERRVFAYEALVRGPHGEPSITVLSQVNEQNLYEFDQSCRIQAITLAANLGLVETGACLAINFLPGAVYTPAACIRVTLNAADKVNFPSDRLIFEVSEAEHVTNPAHLQSIADEYCRHGFRMALDDFGAGFANMSLLADLSVDIVKIDMALIRDIHLRPKAQMIVASLAALGKLIRADVVAEGVETVEEYAMVRSCGVRLMQGYLLARPAFEALPTFTLPTVEAPSAISMLPRSSRGLHVIHTAA
ncbi:EAL domain-containing protein [Terriglobus roseus DSM 18391]|uniref:EAL domain-containing protein n=2 Tax=Terriglobus roseus TaxID=392734 RepID=I3ZKF7_TERRK|nr:EAL domain-containing protein [Terriglobus roseus DSM 18391]